MSYLHTPRLVFSGDFRCDVSTVNNDTAHYNNNSFIPSFQEPGTGATNGWWNPEGGATFDFRNCQVQQLALKDETVLSDHSSDVILGQIVCGADGRPTGKMVDLDPDMQMVSALWSVQLRICTAQNELLLQGDIATTSFRDLQLRQQNGGKSNGQPLGASFTSVIKNIKWGDKASSSPFLNQLKSVTQENKLSINLNVLGYYYTHNDGRFSLGRIIGAIGPWFYGEPDTFAPCRRLYGILNSGSASRPATYFNISNFLVEKEGRKVTIDFGSSFPVADSTGTITITQSFIIAVSKKPIISTPGSTTPVYIGSRDIIKIGQLNYSTGTNWLNQTGGIVSLNNLPDEAFGALSNNQLLLLTPSQSSVDQFAILAREAISGLVVRADNFVQRLDSGNTSMVNFYAYQWGKALAHNSIVISSDPPTPNTPLGPNNPISELYGNNFPVDGLSFSSAITTDNNGFAQFAIKGNAIHSPRVYIDGQIYTLNYQLQNIPNDYNDAAMVPDFICIHLRDYFEIPENPTWDDIAPTMIQYSNLYPLMSKYLVDLSDPVALKAKKDILLFAFSRDISDTMHMPVTRDLSEVKRQTIIKWLNTKETLPNNMKSSKKAGFVSENKVLSSTPLTNAQKKYREAAKAKSGAEASFPVIESLFENL